ncbi:MAG: hypothetical protein ABSF90_20675 [Syntrophobacteraceae bacterium]
MTRKHTIRIILALVLATVVLPGAASLAATKKVPATNPNCYPCHSNPKTITAPSVFLDNSPGSFWLNGVSSSDITTKNATADYLPPILAPQTTPFYSVVQGFLNSEHYLSESVQCTSCHQGDPHDGLNGLPTWQNSCWGCHQASPVDLATGKSIFANFESSPHAANVLYPYFDQPGTGTGQAVTAINGGHDSGLLFQSNGKPVTMSERIAECSVCHSYLSRYPNKFPDGETPAAYPHEVGCGGCHDSHIQGDVATPTNTVTVENTGTTVTSSVLNTTWPPGANPDRTESVTYQNFKPFRVNLATGAQDWVDPAPIAGWDRGSLYERPNRAIVSGGATGTFSNSASGYHSDVFTPGSGSLSGVQPGNKLYITGSVQKTVTLPNDFSGSGTVSVTANFSNAAFTVLSVNSNSLQLYTTSSTFNSATGLSTPSTTAVAQWMGAVGSVSVSYPSTTPSGTGCTANGAPNACCTAAGKGSTCGSTTVYLYPSDTNATPTLTSFTIKDSYTNSEALCASCHAAGAYVYTAYSAQEPKTKPGAAGTSTSASVTMNLPVYDQYKNSAHADKYGTYAKFFMDPANRLIGFTEFNAGNTNFAAGSPVQKTVFPFDMSLPGSNADIPPTSYVGTQINAGDLYYSLNSPPSGVYLSSPGNTTLMTINDSEFWHCAQCHSGLGTIDHQLARTGPWGPGQNLTDPTQASVLWGDAALTCISCHDTHGDNAPVNLVRVPLNVSFHADFASAENPRGGLANTFLDGTAFPTTGSAPGVATVCLVCHQGEESGLTQYYTLYSSINSNTACTAKGTPLSCCTGLGVGTCTNYTLNNPVNPAPSAIDPLSGNSANTACTASNVPYSCCTGSGAGTCAGTIWNTPNPNLTSVNSIHNLPEGAVFWGRGALETPGNFYSNNEAHQAVNCTGCHMDTSVTDTTNQSTGHTWNPNVQTCEKCHSDGSSTISNACGTNSISTPGTQSTTSLNFQTGPQTLTVPTGLSWLTTGLPLTLVSTTELAVQMSGTVTSYASSTGALTVNFTSASSGANAFCTASGAPLSCCTGAKAGTCTGINSFCTASGTPYSCCGTGGVAPSCSNTNAAWFVWTSSCDPWNTIQIPAGDNYAGPSLPLGSNPYTYQQIGSVIPPTTNGPGSSPSYGACAPTGTTTCTGLMGQLYGALYNDGIEYSGGRSFTLLANSSCTAAGTPAACCTGSHAGTCAGTEGMSPAQVAAAFNFNMLSNTSHNFIHNYKYVVQILQDSIVDAGGTQVGERPAGDRPATAYDTFNWSTDQY